MPEAEHQQSLSLKGFSWNHWASLSALSSPCECNNGSISQRAAVKNWAMLLPPPTNGPGKRCFFPPSYSISAETAYLSTFQASTLDMNTETAHFPLLPFSLGHPGGICQGNPELIWLMLLCSNLSVLPACCPFFVYSLCDNSVRRQMSHRDQLPLIWLYKMCVLSLYRVQYMCEYWSLNMFNKMWYHKT